MKPNTPKFMLILGLVTITIYGAYLLFKSESIHSSDLVLIAGLILIPGLIIYGLRLMLSDDSPYNPLSFEYQPSAGLIRSDTETVQQIPWADVEKIDILTTDQGPWAEDLWWLFYLKGQAEPVQLGSEVTGCNQLFNALENHFQTADMETVIQAMGSTSNQVFHIWPPETRG